MDNVNFTVPLFFGNITLLILAGLSKVGVGWAADAFMTCGVILAIAGLFYFWELNGRTAGKKEKPGD